MDDILTRISALIRDLFDEYDGKIDRSLTAAKVPQWDSLGHVQLMVLIEQQFRIKFNSNEIRNFENLGELVDSTAMKVAAK